MASVGSAEACGRVVQRNGASQEREAVAPKDFGSAVCESRRVSVRCTGIPL